LQAYSGWCRLASTPEYEVYRLPLFAGDYVTARAKRLVGLSEEKLKQLKEKGIIDY